jgi:thymidylate synthase
VKIIQTGNNQANLLEAYRSCMRGDEVAVRGSKTRNVQNMAIVFDPATPVLSNFLHRDFNLNYCRREWLWYLGADPKDDSIEAHAKMWAKIKQSDGSYFSNYGQYIFGGEFGKTQFEFVVNQLKKDPHSRRASMVLLKQEHLFDENPDVVCTYGINFCIAGNSLDMTVMMRSNDVVFGLTNDAFCFQQLYEFVYQLLSTKHAGLRRGRYVHLANSMHVYDRHYTMLGKILADSRLVPLKKSVPRPTPKEVVDLFKSRGKEGSGDYVDWLKTID